MVAQSTCLYVRNKRYSLSSLLWGKRHFIMVMRKILIVLYSLCLLFSCKKQEKDAAEIVGKTAKIYYDYLLHDNYEAFVDGSYRPDSIPPSYREQLIANAKMFIGQQKEEHQGIKEITISNATIDTLHHTGNAFLLFSYGDKTTEQVIVPMVERKGVWYMR